ncbi:MAG: hypothetical protein Q8862_12855, partial [Bacteroidota bacterium]|nr:hypothetical protein [Bacteroidota bacterium]
VLPSPTFCAKEPNDAKAIAAIDNTNFFMVSIFLIFYFTFTPIVFQSLCQTLHNIHLLTINIQSTDIRPLQKPNNKILHF